MPNTHGRRPSPPVPHTGNSKPPPPPVRSGRSVIDGCPMAVPVAIALLPYALVRMAWDDRRHR